MANEYNELEQLVNDVTNIDTARMTLRWALERLNGIEKEKAELKKNLTITEETRKALELKVQSLEDSFKSRAKTLDEKEDFYTKLEATMALLGDGKLDIQQLLKKEARLGQLRNELENEYQDKFEELDKNQSSVIARWNQRLLAVEGQYAGRLSEAQTRYDALRQELEADYQARLGALEASYQRKEKELTARISALESSVKAGEDGLENRRRELESEFLNKKNEIEANYGKLKSMLEAGFQERIHSAENDNYVQVRALEKTWNAERERLMQEQRMRDEQFKNAQQEMARLEGELSARQERHHAELIAIISRKEEAFRAKVAELEAEKAVYESAVKKLGAQLEEKESAWVVQKEELHTEFVRRYAELESSVKERAVSLEKEYSARKEELKGRLVVAKEEFEKEASARVERERRAMEEEKTALAERSLAAGSALAGARASIKELEGALEASKDEHHRELMAKIRENEEAFRLKLSEFEAEKEEYKAVISRLAEEARGKDSRLIEEKQRLQGEFSVKYASLEAELSVRDEKSLLEKAAYETRMADLAAGFVEKEKAWMREKDKLSGELAVIARDAQARAAERVEKIKAAYDDRKAELEKQFEEKFAARAAALEVEKERVNGELACVREELCRMAGRAEELKGEIAGDRRAHHAELMAGLADKEAALKAQAEDFARELAIKDETAGKYAREAAEREQLWAGEKEALSADFAARFRVLESGLAQRESALERQYRLKESELDKNAGETRELLEADYARRLAAEKENFEKARTLLAEESRLREGQLAASHERLKDLEKRIGDLKDEHHTELMARLAEKEAALKVQAENFDKELRALREAFGARESSWTLEKEKFGAALLEASVRAENEMQARVAQIRAEYESKKAELEKLLGERLADGAAVLKLETEKIREESRLKDEQLGAAHGRVKELENRVNAMSGAHHEELMARLAERETALKAQAAAYTEEMNELRAQAAAAEESSAFEKTAALKAQAAEFAQKAELTAEEAGNAARQYAAAEKRWSEEKAELAAEFAARCAALEKGLAEKENMLERRYRSKEAELDRNAVKARDIVENDFAARLAVEKEGYEKAAARLTEENRLKDAQVSSTHEKLKELEQLVGEMKDGHYAEITALRSEKESALKAQAAGSAGEFNALRESFNARVAALLGEKEAALREQAERLNKDFRGREESWGHEKEKLNALMLETSARAERDAKERVAAAAAQYSARKAESERILNEKLAEKDAALRTQAAEFAQKLALKDEAVRNAEQELAGADKKWALEKEALSSDFAARFRSLEKGLAERESVLESQYRLKTSELEKKFEENSTAASAALAFEKAHMVADLKTASEEYTRLKEQFKELETTVSADRQRHHSELMEKLEEKESALKAQAGVFEQELEKLRDGFRGQAAGWAAEKEKLEEAMAAAAARTERELKDGAALLNAEYEDRKAELARILESRLAEKESVFKLEIEKVMEDGRLRDAQLSAAHERVRELENKVNGMSEAHHQELMARLAEKETALKAQAERFAKDADGMAAAFGVKEASLARDKGAALKAQADHLNNELALKDAQLRKQAQEAAAREKQWAEEKAALNAEFAARARELADSLAEKSAALENQYRLKEAELGRNAAKARGVVETDFAERLAVEKAGYEKAAARLTEENRLKDAQLASTHDKLKELERRIGAVKDEHHAELMARQADKEAALKAQADSSSGALAELRDTFNARMASLAGEKEAALKAQAAGFAEELALKKEEAGRYAQEAAAREKQWAQEKAALNAEFAARARELADSLAEKSAALENQYRLKEAELGRNAAKARGVVETDFAERLAVEKAGYEKAAARLTEENRLKDAQLASTHDKLKELERRIGGMEDERHAELLTRQAEKEAALKEQAAELSRKAVEARELAQAELTRRFAAEKAGLEKELGRLAEENLHNEELLSAEHEKIKVLENRINEFTAARHAETAATSAALEAEYSARREALISEVSAREEALNKEAAARMESERAAWQAQRGRLEATAAGAAEDFKRAQKEIEELSALNRRLGEQLVERTAGFDREMLEAKAGYEKELNLRLKDTVEAQTAPLLETLEAVRRRNKELSDAVSSREDEISRLNSELAGKDRQTAEDIKIAENAVLAAGAAELEAAYKERKERLAAETAALRSELEKEHKTRIEKLAAHYEARSRQTDMENGELKAAVAKLREEALEAQRKAGAHFTELTEQARAYQEAALKLKEGRAAELNSRIEAAVAEAVRSQQEKLRSMESELSELRRSSREESRLAEEAIKKEKTRLAEELSRGQASIEAADLKIREMQDELMKSRQNSAAAYMDRITDQDEKLRALKSAYDAREEKLKKEAAELVEQARNGAEIRLKELEEEVAAKEQLLSEGAESWQRKQLELDARRDEKFNALLEEYQARQRESEKQAALAAAELKSSYDARLKELEEQLKAKEQRIREGGEFWRQKQLDLDAQHSALNLKLHSFNEEIFAQKQAMSEREKVLNEQRLALESGYVAKMGELEKLRMELTRAIVEYKNRK